MSSHSRAQLALPPVFGCTVCGVKKASLHALAPLVPPSPARTTVALLAFPKCGHVHCHDCLLSWVRATVTDRTLHFPTKCTDPACDASLTVEDARVLLEHVTYRNLLHQYLVRDAEGKRILAYCPRPGCSMAVQVPPPEEVVPLEDATRMCPQCSTAFCPVCRVDDHRPRRCVEYKVSRLAERDRNPHLYALNELARTNSWRRCPVCRIFTERVDEGDYVQCLCGTGFCFLCSSRYQFDTRSRKYPHGEPSCLCHERLGPPVNDPDSPYYDPTPKPDSMATLSFSDADEESDADYHPDLDAMDDGDRVLDNPWAPNDWPRAASGYRIMPWGTGYVRFPTKKERKLPKWLARTYLAKTCHYCQQMFPTFADLVNHFHTTNKHHVYLCCNRTFKDEPAYFDHLNDVHGGDIENW